MSKCKNKKFAKEMRFKVQLEEKEVDLLALEDYDSESNEENSVLRDEPKFSLEPHLPKQEQTSNLFGLTYRIPSEKKDRIQV